MSRSGRAWVMIRGSWVCGVLPTTSGRIISWMAESSWDKMWQCQTDVPAMVYLPTQTVMVSLGATKVSLGPDSHAPGDWNGSIVEGTGVAAGVPLTHVPAPDEAQLDQMLVDRVGIRAVVAHRPRLGRADLRGLRGPVGERPQLKGVAELRDTRRAFAGLHGAQAG